MDDLSPEQARIQLTAKVPPNSQTQEKWWGADFEEEVDNLHL